MPSPKRLLTGMTLDEVSALLQSRTRALRVLRWLHGDPRPEVLPERLQGVSHAAWTRLRASCALPQAGVQARTVDPGGTTRWVLDFGGAQAETVLIPARGRSTVCVSSQAGCTRRCAFCATAQVGFTRSLSAGEIVEQYRIARAAAPHGAPATNVVFMGMGEPLDNLDEVLRAVEVLTQAPAPLLGAAQVTVSTSGVVPGMRRFLRESKASLALSLNATTDAQRTALMPHNRTWPISALLEVLREDQATHPARTALVEYVLFRGVNDSEEDAARLVALLAGLRARVNLIPHNPVGHSPLGPPGDAEVLRFQRRLSAAGARCLVRWPRGRSIAAACGQLSLQGRAAPFTSPAPIL